MNKIDTLEISFDFGSAINKIYPVILHDENDMILIDCGYPGFLPYIQGSAEKQGIDLGRLTGIIITHHDFDHMGALADFKRSYPSIKIISSEIEEKYISGGEKSLRLQQAEALYDKLPEDKKTEALGFHKLLESVEPANVDVLIKHGDIFPWCGGTVIIETPGHMPGHISVYVKEFKTLISGDALVIENGELGIANPDYTMDMLEARKSIRKLLDCDIEKVICYHGGEYTKNIKDSLSGI